MVLREYSICTLSSLIFVRYHIKYMFIGDAIKDEVLKIIPQLRQSLQIRLRFMTQNIKRDDNS